MIQLSVPDITCAQCASVIANAVKGRDPGAKCDVDIETKRVTFESHLPPTDFIEALEEVGYSSFLAQV
ncbi:MAG TPA: heavy-metal-associated domain-containing protein [Usitatibacter sp.]|jgi:copper chaperone CopZ|nr:heavy-metal-associated domain-containing protein [Usitatibacter sp.]